MFKFVQKTAEKPDYIVGGEWSALQKAWRQYRKAKEEVNTKKMTEYATKIRNLQSKLGLKQSEFPEIP